MTTRRDTFEAIQADLAELSTNPMRTTEATLLLLKRTADVMELKAGTKATPCPEWCRAKEIEDHAEDGHDGPAWPSLPNNGGFHSVEIGVQLSSEGLLSVVVSAPHGIDLTGEEALKAGRYLIEAGQWVTAHHA